MRLFAARVKTIAYSFIASLNSTPARYTEFALAANAKLLLGRTRRRRWRSRSSSAGFS
jgi:hypothetical protein